MGVLHNIRKAAWGILGIGKATIESALDINIVESDKMFNAISIWELMYTNNAPWVNNKEVVSCNLSAEIAGLFAQMVTIENKINIEGSSRADFLSDIFKIIKKDLRTQTEYGCALGGLIFKPCVVNGKIKIDYIKPNAFYPVAFDDSGRINNIVFIEQFVENYEIYTRTEQHISINNTITIENHAFLSLFSNELGKEIELKTVERWRDIEKVVTINDVETPLYGYFKIPFANQIDTDSPLGVSVFSRAVKQIEQADIQFGRLLWEFEGSELAVDAAGNLFKKGSGGINILPKGKERLFRAHNDIDDSFIKTYSPAIRDVSQINGLNEIEKKIEDLCGIARGSISSPDVQARTATELNILKQRSYSTVADIQKCLEFALSDLLEAMNVLATLYNLAPSGGYKVAFDWDDSIIADEEKNYQRRKEMQADRIISRVERRMKEFNESKEDATAAIKEIDELDPSFATAFGD